MTAGRRPQAPDALLGPPCGGTVWVGDAGDDGVATWNDAMLICGRLPRGGLAAETL